jgi:hypothetical protein
MEVSGEFLNNVSLSTIKDIVGQEGVCGNLKREKTKKRESK